MNRLVLMTRLVLTATLAGACASASHTQRPDTFEARKRLTRELVARRDLPEAFVYATRLHSEKPHDAEVLVMRGTVYREQGLFTEAEADFREALGLHEEDPDGHAALALLLDETERGAEAEKHHERAIALAPTNPALHNNAGFSLFLRRKFEGAVAHYQAALRLDPVNRRIRTNLGYAYAGLNDWPRAAREFDKGALSPGRAKNNLGFAYERHGNLATAFALYEQAVRLDPACTEARQNLLAVALKLNRPLPEDLPSEADASERKQP
jgi:Flp pilus assembly protein TadD